MQRKWRTWLTLAVFWRNEKLILYRTLVRYTMSDLGYKGLIGNLQLDKQLVLLLITVIWCTIYDIRQVTCYICCSLYIDWAATLLSILVAIYFLNHLNELLPVYKNICKSKQIWINNWTDTNLFMVYRNWDSSLKLLCCSQRYQVGFIVPER